MNVIQYFGTWDWLTVCVTSWLFAACMGEFVRVFRDGDWPGGKGPLS